MTIAWFDTTEVDDLANRLADALVKRIPLTSFGNYSKKAESIKIKTREAMLRQVRDFTSKHRLNVYKKARLANQFKWRLREAGYPKEFVDDMAFELAAVMATTTGTPA